jgi:hypothetical protein
MLNPKVPILSPLDVPPTTVSLAVTGEPFIRQTFGALAAAVEPKLVLAIMSFEGKGMGGVLNTVRTECARLGLKAARSDDAVGSQFVMKQVGSLIERAALIVCDLTYERPNVYYELGYAHGVGNGADNILMVARAGTTLHFDIGPLRVNYYSSLEKLRTILQKNLAEMHRIGNSKRLSAAVLPSVIPSP